MRQLVFLERLNAELPLRESDVVAYLRDPNATDADVVPFIWAALEWLERRTNLCWWQGGYRQYQDGFRDGLDSDQPCVIDLMVGTWNGATDVPDISYFTSRDTTDSLDWGADADFYAFGARSRILVRNVPPVFSAGLNTVFFRIEAGLIGREEIPWDVRRAMLLKIGEWWDNRANFRLDLGGGGRTEADMLIEKYIVKF